MAWYPGARGGDAVAETILGRNNPAGRLPITIPRAEGQIPVYYNKNALRTTTTPISRPRRSIRSVTG